MCHRGKMRLKLLYAFAAFVIVLSGLSGNSRAFASDGSLLDFSGRGVPGRELARLYPKDEKLLPYFEKHRWCQNGPLILPCDIVTEDRSKAITQLATPRPAVTSTTAGLYLSRFLSDCGRRMKYRIINGTVSRTGDWTWTVALLQPIRRKWEVYCGGTLITDRHVLTAAHCIDMRTFRTTRIRVGQTYLVSEGLPDDIPPQTVLLHPEYNSATKFADIAIIELMNSVELSSSVTTCCLAHFDVAAGRKVMTMGWGNINPNVSVSALSPNLREIELPVVAQEQCNKMLNFAVPRTAFCAGGEEGLDTCVGDSGGPVVVMQDYRWFLVGIVSAGESPCGMKNKPALYTRLVQFKDWIIKAIG